MWISSSSWTWREPLGFQVENDNCKMETNWFSQAGCPAENKDGFYLNDEMSPDWDDLDQTQVRKKSLKSIKNWFPAISLNYAKYRAITGAKTVQEEVLLDN